MARGGPRQPDEPEREDIPRLLETLPFAEYALRHAQAVESRLLSVLKRKLDGMTPSGDSAPPMRREEEPGDAEREPGAMLAQLLDRSLEQREEDAEREFLLRVVDQLGCDEARILAALSDGQAAVACQVGAASRVGLTAVPVLRYASRVGVEAGVMLRAQVPAYIGHLLALGLIETAPEDREQAEAYDMLMSDEAVRETVRHIQQELKLQARVSRFSLQLSGLGRRLWERSDAARG